MKAIFLKLLAAALALALMPAVHAQSSKPVPEKPDAVVVRLYRDFAWQAVFSPRRNEINFIDQPREVLERYLEPGLAVLLVADRECAKRTREICKLDMDPLFDSQDTAAVDLKVSEPDSANVVTVRYTYPGNGQKVEIRHEMAKTSRGWRIKDIRYKTGVSLRKLLSQGE